MPILAGCCPHDKSRIGQGQDTDVYIRQSHALRVSDASVDALRKKNGEVTAKQDQAAGAAKVSIFHFILVLNLLKGEKVNQSAFYGALNQANSHRRLPFANRQ